VAQDGGSGKGTFDVNDTITLVLSERTDRGGLPEVVSRQQIDSFLSFNQNLGANYSGQWLESGVWVSPVGPGVIPDVPYSRILKITIHNTSGAWPPTIDTLRATFLPSARIRNVPPVCAPASSTSPVLSGDFGPSQITIKGISARGDVNCDGECDSVYGDGDVIDIEFGQEVTMCMDDCGCQQGNASSPFCVRRFDGIVSQGALDASYSWSHPLGTAYYGEWLTRRILRLTVTNATGAAPPQLYALTVKVVYAAGIRNYPPTGDRSLPSSNGLCETKRNNLNLDCAFGKPDIVIDRLIAFPSASREDPANPGRLSVGDRLVLVFNAATSLGLPMLCLGGNQDGASCTNGLSCQDFIMNLKTQTKIYLETGGVCTASPMALNEELRKVTVDALFQFSTEIGADYTGLWTANNRFEITIREIFAAENDLEPVIQVGTVTQVEKRIAPAVGCAACVNANQLVAAVRREAAISNVPIASMAQRVLSPPLEGDLGPEVVKISYVVADDPTGANDFYSPGDTITIVFSEATNMGGLPSSNIPKDMIDALMTFSEPIGSNYVANWRCGPATRNLCPEFETSTDALGNEVQFSRYALEITLLDITGVRGLEVCDDPMTGCDDVSIDMAGFTISLLPQGPYPPHVWASNFTTGGPGIRNFPAQCAPSTSTYKGVQGRFGKLLKIYNVQPSRLPAAGGYITIAGRGFGWNPKSVSVTIGSRAASHVSLPTGWSFPVPQLQPQTIVALAPPGTGARGMRLIVALRDDFSPDSLTASLEGLIFYAAPSVAALMPTRLNLAPLQAFEETPFAITIRGRNFGLPSQAAPTVLIYTDADGVHLCGNVSHLSDQVITCLHTVSSQMRTGGARALIAVEVDGQESARDSETAPGCELRYEAVPAFWERCATHSTRECLECCEPECLEELEASPDAGAESESMWDVCKLKCFDFCGLTRVRWHPAPENVGSHSEF
jgi:hypothetical protein